MNASRQELTSGTIYRTWWPLAASWLLMGIELPLLAAVTARLVDPELNLAAFGGVVFPVALLIEAPIIMMLAASTALCVDRASFARLKRFAIGSGVLLSVLHGLIAFTPLFDLLVIGILDPPPEIVEPARLGFRIITPWTVAISDRRFHQGVLIKYGHSRAVGLGSLVRLLSTSSVLVTGLLVGTWNGCAVAAAALTVGVTAEMIFARRVAAPVVRRDLPEPRPDADPLTLQRLLSFYIPLALTPLITLAAQPISSAAMSRMPAALGSLAASQVVFGLIFICRSVGIAYTEVVVRHAGDPGAAPALFRFGWRLGLGTVLLLLLVATTPLAPFWFGTIANLEPELAELAHLGLWFGVLMPGLTVFHSLYQGILVHEHRTRGITEAVALLLVIVAAILFAGIAWQRWPGLPVALAAFCAGSLAQALWLRTRARSVKF